MLNYISIIAAFFLVCSNAYGTNKVCKEFDSVEACNMIRLCNSYTFQELYNDDSKIIPNGYAKYYTSEVMGMDNIYEIYLKDSVAVFNFRGSTDKGISWLENIHSAMIPAIGTIQTEEIEFNYCFAQDSLAAVHGGFALGIAYLHKDILGKIEEINKLGFYKIIITGHSQGGALSNLLRAYLENLPDSVLNPLNSFKTYAFAAPMVGNVAFTREYNARYCKPNTSFNINNATDGIPKLPTSFNDSSLYRESIKTYFTDPFKVKYVKLFWYTSFKLFRGSLSRLVKKTGEFTAGKIRKDLGYVVLPPYTKEINYVYVDNTINIPRVNYPVFYADSVTLENEDIYSVYERDLNEHFSEIKNGAKMPPGFQHQPYNYYISFLLRFFPETYTKLEDKFLPENL